MKPAKARREKITEDDNPMFDNDSEDEDANMGFDPADFKQHPKEHKDDAHYDEGGFGGSALNLVVDF